MATGLAALAMMLHAQRAWAQQGGAPQTTESGSAIEATLSMPPPTSTLTPMPPPTPTPTPALAQTSREVAEDAIGAVRAVEAIVGWAGFVDDSTIHHTVIGVAVPLRLTRSLSVGPELLYMIGPGSDRDLLLFGNVWWDLIGADGPRPRPVVPYFTAGAGLFHHSDDIGGTGSEAYVGAGGGVRVQVTDRLYVAGELQLAWELHFRSVARVGVRLGPQ